VFRENFQHLSGTGGLPLAVAAFGITGVKGWAAVGVYEFDVGDDGCGDLDGTTHVATIMHWEVEVKDLLGDFDADDIANKDATECS
jgi:hypothetical protein